MSAQSNPAFKLQFPFDIERLIFERAAHDDKRIVPDLALVCRRVQSWSVD
jgi:hypothetical protein